MAFKGKMALVALKVSFMVLTLFQVGLILLAQPKLINLTCSE